MIKYLSRVAAFAGALAVVAVALLFLGSADSPTATAQNYFNPCVRNALASSAGNSASDIKTTLGLGIDPTGCGRFGSPQDRAGEWNSGGLIYFTPPGWGIAKDADIPDGTKVGDFKSEAVLGLLNNGCNLVLNVNFNLLDGTIDRSDPVEPLAPGKPDRLKPMSLPDANGVPMAASHWPSYLTTIADNDHVGMDLTKLIARFVGINTTDVTGTTVVLQFLVFEPGARVSNRIQLDPRLGYPAVTILQDPTGSAADSDPVSDFCAPLWAESTLAGSAGGKDFRKNPADGVYNFTTYIVPAPDADNDGIENGLDPCPYIANSVGWDPRAPLVKLQTPGDPDIDGLASDPGCDPNPDVASECSAGTGASNADEDCDKWQNRGDNCPLLANPDQLDDDGDAIGDACDQNIATVPPETVDGRHAPVCIVNAVTVGAGGAAPTDNPLGMAPCDPTVVITPTPGPGQPNAPTPTFIPGTTTRPSQAASNNPGGVGTGPISGVGSLAVGGNDIPVWAAILAAVGVLGLAFGLSVTGTRIWRRR